MLRVIYRTQGGETVAYFPELPGDMNPANMLCYAHIGQHGTAAESYARGGRPATDSEAQELERELYRQGYQDLWRGYRFTRHDYCKRVEALAKTKES